MAAYGVSYSRWQAVLWWNLFSAERWLWASQLQARAAEHCQCLQRKKRRRDGAGEDGRDHDRAERVVRRTQRAGFGGHYCCDSEIGFQHVRRAAWRVWACSEVSASFGAGFVDREVCEKRRGASLRWTLRLRSGQAAGGGCPHK